MSKNQYNQIYHILVSAMYNKPHKEIIPVFLNNSYENGLFLINCANQVTYLWLKKTVGKIPQTRDNVMLEVHEKIRYRPIIANVFIEDSNEPTHVILKQLAKQNPQLYEKSFYEKNRKVIKSGLLLSFSITIEMLNELILVDKRPFYKLGRLNFKTNRN